MVLGGHVGGKILLSGRHGPGGAAINKNDGRERLTAVDAWRLEDSRVEQIAIAIAKFDQARWPQAILADASILLVKDYRQAGAVFQGMKCNPRRVFDGMAGVYEALAGMVANHAMRAGLEGQAL